MLQRRRPRSRVPQPVDIHVEPSIIVEEKAVNSDYHVN
jgi:hypothetical protein